jgi:hypothetical protein
MEAIILMQVMNDGGVCDRGDISTNESMSTFRIYIFQKLKDQKNIFSFYNECND